MAKTLKQIADELRVEKQQVYRYVKKHGIEEMRQEAQQKQSAKYYDEVAENLIKQGFQKKETHQETHQKHSNDALYDALLKQLEEKDKQIEHLHTLLDQQQKLSGNLQKQLDNQQPLLETKENDKKWYQKIKLFK